MSGRASQGQSQPPLDTHHSHGHTTTTPSTSDNAQARDRGQAMVMGKDPREEEVEGEMGATWSYPSRTSANYVPLPRCQLGGNESEGSSWSSKAGDEYDDEEEDGYGGRASEAASHGSGGEATRKRKAASRFTGVGFHKDRRKPWQARIGFRGRHKSLGYYETEEEAAAVYRKAAKERDKDKPEKSSRYRGVTKTNTNVNPWRAQIQYDGKMKHLGLFSTEEEAAIAYDRAAKKHHKQDAILNFPADQDGGSGLMELAGERSGGDASEDSSGREEEEAASISRPMNCTSSQEGSGGGRRGISEAKPARPLKQEEGGDKVMGRQYRGENEKGKRTKAPSGGGGGMACGGGMMMAAGSSPIPSSGPPPSSPPSTSRHGVKDEGNQDTHSKPQVKPSATSPSASIPSAISSMPSTSISGDDDDDSVEVIDPPSSSRPASGGGVTTTTTQVKRRRGGEEGGRHGGGKEAVESPVPSPDRKVKRGQEGPRGGSHDRRPEGGRPEEGKATGAMDQGGGGVVGAVSSVPPSGRPFSSHASARAIGSSTPHQPPPPTMTATTPPDINDMREKAMGLLYSKMMVAEEMPASPGAAAAREKRLFQVAKSIEKGEGDHLLRAMLVHAKVDMESDEGKKLLLAALLDRFESDEVAT